MRTPGATPPPAHFRTILQPFGCLPPGLFSAGLSIPAEVYAAVRIDDTGLAARAFGPFADKAAANAFVAEELSGNGYVIQFELIFQRP